jgi:hypothetical protein
MYTLINTTKNKLVGTLKSNKSLIDKVRLIAKEDKHRIAPIDTIEDCFEHINQYTLDYGLVKDSEVNSLIKKYFIEINENESEHYIEMMIDEHEHIKWKNKYYYVSDSLVLSDLSDDELKIYDMLVFSLHV